MPECVSAHQIPGVRQLGRRDEADTPGLLMLMRDNGPPSQRYQMISIARPWDNASAVIRCVGFQCRLPCDSRDQCAQCPVLADSVRSAPGSGRSSPDGGRPLMTRSGHAPRSVGQPLSGQSGRTRLDDVGPLRANERHSLGAGITNYCAR